VGCAATSGYEAGCQGVTKGLAGRPSTAAARDAAIAGAVADAAENDTILIAGKGHETYQEVAGVRHPFLDLDHARTALGRWGRA